MRSRGRRRPCANAAAQARACWRYAVMIGVHDPPPSTGSPCRRRCSSTRRDRRPGFFRGIGAVGLTSTSISLFGNTPSKPKPSLLQRLRNLASLSRPFPRRREASGQPNFVAGGRPVDPLQDELEIESQLQPRHHRACQYGRSCRPYRRHPRAPVVGGGPAVPLRPRQRRRGAHGRFRGAFRARLCVRHVPEPRGCSILGASAPLDRASVLAIRSTCGPAWIDRSGAEAIGTGPIPWRTRSLPRPLSPH